MIMRLSSSEGMGLVWTLKPARRGQAPQIPGPSGPGGKLWGVPGAAPTPHWEAGSSAISRGKGSGGTYPTPPWADTAEPAVTNTSGAPAVSQESSVGTAMGGRGSSCSQGAA